MSRLAAGQGTCVGAYRSPSRSARVAPGSITSPRRLTGVGCVVVSMLALACACSGTPSPVGDPDPGHLSMSALEQVLSAIPADAQVIYENRVEPRWDSCDGRQSTYGWDPAVVNARFKVGTASEQQVVAGVRTVLGKLDWTYDRSGSRGGQWLWLRQVSGRTASATLQSGVPGDPHAWSLYAQAPPAVHPVTGC